ncbi:19181_t:CDS:10 [Dentiscutata erythropus]|uniref:19181_t:CDS:1 n=1 Tax=Dentiscutata erythropus TaxID=1348616 RepID=A0A9N8WF58_9GLOM|nr:19181_t:CDS:10 [Dentiscutata erythropus]
MATSGINQNVACSRRPIPRDEETRKKAMRVIDAQFDLEILLRQRELQKIKEELKKSEIYLETLRHCILEPPSNSSSSHRTSTLNASTYSENLGVASLTPTRHSTRKIYSTRDNDYFYYDPCKDLYSRRNDGTFVRLACPKCHRSKFINVQGFLNHCRLSHRIEFPNHEEALLKCGTPVDESLIPPGHPARSRIITRPPSLRTILGKSNLSTSRTRDFNDGKNSENRPTIKVFEEEIDLGLDELSNGAEINDSNEAPLVQKLPSNNEITSYSENSPSLLCHISDHITKISEDHPMLGSPDGSDSDYSSDIDEGDTGTTTISATCTIPACTSVFDPIDHGSRFYIKRRIVVGNVSKWINPEKRDSSLRKYTHKWMVYVTGPPHDLNITPFIRRVRFFLHPSYRPLDVVDVTEPPFQLTRFGWGEFPIQIQIIFVDNKNKPVDLIHNLKLDNIHNGKQQLGNERAFDLELDRNTQFIDPKAEGPINHTINIVRDIPKQDISETNNALIETDAKESLQKEKSNDRLDSEIMNALEPLLNKAVKNFSSITGFQVTWCKCCGCPESWHEINTSTSKSVSVPVSPYKCKRRPHFLETKKTKLCSLTLVQDFSDELYQDKVLSGNESINTCNEDSNLNNNGISVELVKNMSELKDWYTFNPQGIDWIWDVVGQLKLDGVVATKLIKYDGKIEVEDGDINVAIQQRLETGNLIFQLTKIFLKDLVNKAINVYKSEQLDDPFTPEINWFSRSALDSRYNSYRQRIKKILVPYHFYQAIQANLNTFDFLNGEGLASDKKKIQE